MIVDSVSERFSGATQAVRKIAMNTPRGWQTRMCRHSRAAAPHQRIEVSVQGADNNGEQST